MRMPRWLVFFVVSSALAGATAQTLDASLARGAAARTGAALALEGLRDADLSADLTFGMVAAASDVDALLAARWSRAATLGLLGAVSLEFDGALRTDGSVRAALAGRGVLGPASVGIVLGGRSAEPERFSVVGLVPLSDAPRLPGSVWSAAIDVRYRIDRQFLLALEPAVFISSAGFAARLDGSLRVRRVWREFDALGAWHGWYDPITGGVAAGVGGGVVWAPRRAPEWRGLVWFGFAGGAATPGLEVRGRSDLAEGVGIDLTLIAQPFRLDVPPYRASAELTVDVAASEVYGRAELQSVADAASFAGAFTVGVRVPFGAR